MKIGEKIKIQRTELGLTLEQVGDYVGVSKSTVRKWETGYIANMKRDKISLLAKVLQMSPSEFISTDTTDISPAAPVFNENEKELVKIYRNVNEDGQNYIMQTARMVEGTEQYRRPAPKQDEEEVPVLVAARSFGGDKPPEPIRLKKRSGAGSILDLPDYNGD